MSTLMKINLGEFTSTGNRYFTSRSRGIDVSRKVGLERLTKSHQKITLSFPADLRGINTLFLEELLELTILTLTPGQDFNDVFNIENHSLYNVEALIAQTVHSLEQKKEELQTVV